MTGAEVPGRCAESAEQAGPSAEAGAGRRRFLLLDARLVEAAHNAEVTLGAVTKHAANPLFGEDRPWEKRFDNVYANVLYDDEEEIYKCWYSPFVVDQSSKGMTLQERRGLAYRPPRNREMAICYATSKDGLSWDKPELGIVEYAGSRANNILMRGGGDQVRHGGPHGSGILKDPRDPDPNRRYKAFFKSEVVSVAFSADGVHWGRALPRAQADSSGDTHNNVLWAPTLDRYVGITRQWGKPLGRQVVRTSSVDFVDWEKPRVVLQGLDENKQTYAMPVFFHGGVYLGLVAIHDQDADRVWGELAWSSDTESWHRIRPGTPLIPNGLEEGDCDWGCVFAAAYPVFLDDEIRLYYGASDGLHTSWRNGFLCLATLRPDGFAGYKASHNSEPALVTTAAVFDPKFPLRVSSDVAEGGKVVVRVLGQDRRVLAESEPLTTTGSDTLVRWQNGARAASETGRARLQFAFEGATVYSFASGREHGADA